jgi:hypothetical protein
MKIAFNTFLSLYVFYIFYLAIMSLYRAKLDKTITRTSLVIGYPILAVGAFIDLAMNVTLFSLIFWEIPHEWLLTKRMQRYIKIGIGWRFKVANWICRNLLNTFDPSGRHC